MTGAWPRAGVAGPALKAGSLLLLLLGAGALAARQAWLLRQAVRAVRQAPAQAFEARPPHPRARVLLLGDSTGVGQGAGRPECTLPGLLASELQAVELVNRCRSGARVADVAGQLDALPDGAGRFDLALVLAGGNDVLHMTGHGALAGQAALLLQRVERFARRTVWVGCADVGDAPVLLPPLSWWFSWRSRRTMRLLAAQARRRGVDFIDFAEHNGAALLARWPRLYFARDGVHPNAVAHRLCWDVLKQHAALGALRLQTQRAKAAWRC